MRRDQPDETDGAGDGHRPADTQRHADNNDEPEHADIDPKALRRFLAETERSQRAPLAEQNSRTGKNERHRQYDVTKVAVRQRAKQPECDLERHERITRQIHGERRRRTGEAGDGEAGENQNQQSGIAASNAEQHEHR